MEKLYIKNDVYNILKENEIVFIYFWSSSCGVCEVHKPKISEMLTHYPKIKRLELEVEKNVEIVSQLNVFTVPAVLVFVKGKETLREAGFINLPVINKTLEKYYNLIY